MDASNSTRARSATLTELPEELLEKILAHALTPPPRTRSYTTVSFTPYAPSRSSSSSSISSVSSTTSSSSSSNAPITPRSSPHAPLLADRKMARIGAPLVLRAVTLTTPAQAERFIDTLSSAPGTAAHVRTLSLACPLDTHVAAVLRACSRVKHLELILPGDEAVEADLDTASRTLTEALAGLRGLQTLTVRKGAYLSGPRAKAVLFAISRAVPSWMNLHTATLAFRLPTSSCPSTSALLTSLSTAPSLTTMRTVLPQVWNPALLTLSGNAMLQKIVLAPTEHDAFLNGSEMNEMPAVESGGLWMRAAREHTRLFGLVKAGTTVGRARAMTMGTGLHVNTGACPTSPTKHGVCPAPRPRGPMSASAEEAPPLPPMPMFIPTPTAGPSTRPSRAHSAATLLH